MRCFGSLLAVALILTLAGCIPVTVRPQFDENNMPIALPVTPTGSIGIDGTITPIYKISDKSPTAFNWGAVGGALGAITTALLAAYGINLRSGIAKAKTALAIACELADANANAETNDDVRANKAKAQAKQEAAGVRHIVQRVRGK